MLILYRKISRAVWKKRKGVGKIKQSGMGNKKRVKRFKHGGIEKEESLWRGVTGVKY